MSDTAAAAPAAPAAPTTGSAQPAAENSSQASAKSQGAGSAQPVANQPTKSELKELAEDNLDAMVAVKVNGQVKKVTVRDALKLAELGDGAQAKMQQSAQLRKQAERLLSLAKSDPDKFFQETGIDPDQYAEQRLVKKYEKMAMTPEQKKAAEREEKLKHFEARENQTRAQVISQIKNLADNLPPEYVKALEGATQEQLDAELKGAQARHQQHMQQAEKELIEAWETSGFPKDTIFGTWMASLMHSSQVQKNAGQREQALSAKDAASIVKENFLSAVSRITGQMDAEAIHRLLGSETMKKLREFDVQRVTGKSAPHLERSNGPAPAASPKKNAKHVNEQGWNSFFANVK